MELLNFLHYTNVGQLGLMIFCHFGKNFMFVSQCPIDMKLSIVQVFGLCQTGDKQLPMAMFSDGCWFTSPQWVNSSPPGQNGHNFTDNTFNCIFMNAASHYQCWPSSLTHLCGTGGRWVKPILNHHTIVTPYLIYIIELDQYWFR